jgi:hypothetical protein
MANRPSTQPKPRWLEGDTEARRFEREGTLGLTLKNPVPATVLDMSTAGICIEGDHRLTPLEQRTFTLELGASRAYVRGEIRWCRLTAVKRVAPGDWQAVYRSGIALLEPLILA